MLFRFLAAAGVLFGIWLGIRWFAKQPPAKVVHAVKMLALGALVAAGVWLLATGRLAGLLAVGAGLAPWAVRGLKVWMVWRSLKRSAENAQAKGSPQANSGPMTREEAYDVLGLSPEASDEEITAAHRRLMRLNHPDHGGSNWIASRLNQARDLLLRRG